MMPGSDDLTADQLAELLKAIESQLYFVAKLKHRMEAHHWPNKGPLLVDTRLALFSRAAGEVHQLRLVRVHRLVQELKREISAEILEARQNALLTHIRQRDAALEQTTRWEAAR